MKLNFNKRDSVILDTNLRPPQTRRRNKTLARAISVVLLAGSAVPASGWAANIKVHRFVDDGDNAYNGEPLYTEPGVIFLKRSGASASYIVLTNGEHQGYPISPDSTYTIWQFVNPASLATLGISLDQIPWSSEATALNLTVDASEHIQVDDPNSPFSISGQDSVDIYFPFPNLQNNDDEINLKKQELEGKCATPDVILCGYNPDGSYSYPSECNSYPDAELILLNEDSSWDNYMVKDSWNNSYLPSSSLKEAIEGKVVLTYGVVIVPYYGSTNPISVLGMCNYGTLKSPVGAQALVIEFEDATDDGLTPKDENFFANFGQVEGSVPPSPNDSCNYYDISLKGRDVILEGTFSPFEMLGIEVFSGTFYNEGTIQGGNSVNFVDGNVGCYIDDPYWYFEQQTSTGGSVSISFSGVYEKGATFGGEGFSAHYQYSWDAWASCIWDDVNQQDVCYGAGKGGNITLEGANLIASMSSFVKGGDGGDVTADDTCEDCSIEVKGGIGGTVTANFNNANAGNGEPAEGFSGFKGGSIYFDPDIMIFGQGTHFEAEEDIVIYGGDNWQLKLNNLSDNAIVAGRNIILAVGNGGTIDLRNNNGTSKIFNAGGKVEIYADNVLLDQGVQLEDLIQASEIVRGPNKIIYRVILNAQDVQGEAKETVPIELKVSNAGPKEDTYTLSVVSENGTTISGLPSSITVEGLKHKKLHLNTTLSENQGVTDLLTVTATSQADPTVVATTKIIVNVAKDSGPPNLVELANFTATAENGGIRLDWETASEIDNAGFFIVRARQDENGEYTEITRITLQPIPSVDGSINGASYYYVDSNVISGNTYYYAIEDIEFSGKTSRHLELIDSATAPSPMARH
ncbi:MAG: hypothetical protein DRR19_30190 [Candidatus Parabeggiatoa sp. nov. 1]|nr:MAG: hypothetical protein DRR19_30190 [Gammaproteobacteria bacterium]